MDFKDLVTLYFERTNAMQTLWTIYITIVLGMLGFLGTARLRANRRLILILLTVAFLGFATVNLGALKSVTKQRQVAANLIRDDKFDDKPDSVVVAKISGTLDPPAVTGLIAFHVTADVATLVAMWALAYYRNSGK